MAEDQSAPIANTVGSEDSPLGSFSNSIGHFLDGSVDLSPIAFARDSLNSGSPTITSIITSKIQDSPLRLKQKETENTASDHQASLRRDSTSFEHDSALLGTSSRSLKSTRSVFRNPYSNKDHQTDVKSRLKADGCPSWFMPTEATPPLSTSSDEFSLESLSENDGENRMDPSDDPENEASKSDSPLEKLYQEEINCVNDITAKATDEKFQPNKGKPRSAAAPSPTDQGSISKSNNSNASVQCPLARAEVTTTETYTDETEKDPEIADKEKMPAQGVTPATSNSSPRKNGCTVSLEDLSNHSAEMSALVEDATVKVKKFIYELSVLDSSTSPMDSGEDSPQGGSSTSDHGVEECSTERSTSTNAEGEQSSESELGGIVSSNTRKLLPFSPTSRLNGSVDSSRTWRTPTKQDAVNLSTLNSSVNEGTPSKTPGKLDFTNAKKEVGASSFEFIQRIRGAAQRRKQNLARSRDSLVAKEREQREAIASSQMALKPPSPATPSPISEKTEKSPVRRKPIRSSSFRAKPLPATTGDLGSGGLAGVPKVDKKPTTVAMSPLLGSRRLNRPKIKALQEPITRLKIGESNQDRITSLKEPVIRHRGHRKQKPVRGSSNAFKARPAPPTTGEFGRSGQSGVPKVPKRPVTIPASPCLGRRRRHSSVIAGKDNQNSVRRSSTGMVRWTPSCRTSKSKASPMVCSLFIMSITKDDHHSLTSLASFNIHHPHSLIDFHSQCHLLVKRAPFYSVLTC